MNEGPEHPYAKRFHIKIPKDGKPFDFSAMFCGIGDARHLYASIADLAVDMRDLKKVKSASQKIKVHFTLVSRKAPLSILEAENNASSPQTDYCL